MNLITLIRILITNTILLFNNTKQHKSTPARLGKQQSQKFILTQQDLEVICIILFGIMILTCIFLILFSSCTDSGIIYNGELA